MGVCCFVSMAAHLAHLAQIRNGGAQPAFVSGVPAGYAGVYGHHHQLNGQPGYGESVQPTPEDLRREQAAMQNAHTAMCHSRFSSLEHMKAYRTAEEQAAFQNQAQHEFRASEKEMSMSYAEAEKKSF